MQLRWYQQQAVESVYQHLREKDTNPCIVIPTGGGKTPIIATIAHDATKIWGGRICLVADRKELLTQTTETLRRIDPTLDIGVYSASLKSRVKKAAITVAQIQSIYNKATKFDPWDLILVDEAHGIAPDGEGRYQTFLNAAKLMNPNTRLIGLTATPYRLGCGYICAPDHLLHEVCFEVGVKELIAQGFLSKVISKQGDRCDTTGLHTRQGEFIERELEYLMMAKVESACVDIVSRTADRKAALVFCVSVAHAVAVANKLAEIQPARVELVTGQTLSGFRDQYVDDFKAGRIKYLVNVNMLTTGFDAPNVDAIALLRPTLSPGLYYQSVGRGFRLCEGKQDCLVLDYSGNIERHGPIDQIRPPREPGEGGGTAPQKICPQCSSFVHAALTECMDCGFVFPVKEFDKHDTKPSDKEIVSGTQEPPEPTEIEVDVADTRYHQHWKKNAEPGTPSTLKVTYFGKGLVDKPWMEWVCLDHDEGSFAKGKALEWLSHRWPNGPLSVEEAVEIGNKGGFNEPTKIKVKIEGKFPRIEAIEFKSAKNGELQEPRISSSTLPLAIQTLLVDNDYDDVDALCCAQFGCHLKDLEEEFYDDLARHVEYMRSPQLDDVPF